MRRRDFIKVIAGSATSWPLAARAQQAELPVIGYLSGATFETMYDWVTVFKQSLAETGFTEGRDVAIEYRWAANHNDRLPELAADLVRRDVAVIAVGASTRGALARRRRLRQFRSFLVLVQTPSKSVSSQASRTLAATSPVCRAAERPGNGVPRRRDLAPVRQPAVQLRQRRKMWQQ